MIPSILQSSMLVPPSVTGVPHLRDDETPPQGGRPGWVAQPNPRIGPWLRLLKQIATKQGLVPEFEVCALHLQFMISSELALFISVLYNYC